ncbi:MAG: DUF4411 family protein [Spirochaetota bacterium]|nr:DUF4411 family protein [Spirochaetota bacterium]
MNNLSIKTYCIDTSAIIDPWRNRFPPDIFPSIWQEIDNLIINNQLKAPREVYNELENQDDEILEWAKNHKNNLFIDLDEYEQSLVIDILNKFPKLIDYNKTKPDADPFIIALAKSKGYTVVTMERPGSFEYPKIPFVCKDYNVRCINILEFIRELGWSF